jgi:hypothetical protein
VVLGTIKVQRFFLIEDLGGNRARRRRWEGKVPTFHAGSPGKGVLMRQDCRVLRMHPFIAVGVIDMPVRVDEMFDRARVILPREVA